MKAVTSESIARSIVGKVVSVKMNKTIVVQTERKVKHALYGKYIRKISKMYAHDEEGKCQQGDVVLIKMSRPLSKTKTWIFESIVTPFNEAGIPVTE